MDIDRPTSSLGFQCIFRKFENRLSMGACADCVVECFSILFSRSVPEEGFVLQTEISGNFV